MRVSSRADARLAGAAVRLAPVSLVEERLRAMALVYPRRSALGKCVPGSSSLSPHLNRGLGFSSYAPQLSHPSAVAVAPFRHQDCFYFSPIKVFEYMASGACVVASRLGQIAEVIQDGVNGLLCAPDDERDLLAALTRARKSPDLRRRLGTAALHTVRNRYTWARAAEETSRVIQSVIDARRDRLDLPVARIGTGSSDREE